MAAGATPAEIAEYDGSGELTDMMELAFIDMYRAQQTHTWTANIVEGFESVLAAAGVMTPPRPASSGRASSTSPATPASRPSWGDAAAAQLATELGRVVQRTSVQHGGRPAMAGRRSDVLLP